MIVSGLSDGEWTGRRVGLVSGRPPPPSRPDSEPGHLIMNGDERMFDNRWPRLDAVGGEIGLRERHLMATETAQ